MTDLDYLKAIINPLISHPDSISITRTVDEMGTLLCIKAHREDTGRLIGKQGQTANAIRALLRIFGALIKARINLKILEPNLGSNTTGYAVSGFSDQFKL